MFSLDLTLDELSPVDGLGEECYNSSTPGCKSIVPFLKVNNTITYCMSKYVLKYGHYVILNLSHDFNHP